MAVRCVLVDDNVPFLRSAAGLLNRQGIDVVAVAADGAAALAVVTRVRPDVVLVDVDLGTESGFAVARQLDRAAPRPAVIMMSNHAAADFAELVEAGPGLGFVEKPELSGDAIRALLS
ncbi:response regulator [Actinocatenispora sera]|jgi:DNA-binding NarL/FixJ family response regulator|uniref:response regulator n=1 Tax=Actinocatenispora sera TaxID=390989 RepID=UPI0004C3F012|nr:response regulator [Actinocatenispora sera]